ncbi:monovalent cation:proton antiporter-2 (CPA2) family protein [Veronia pacifica]|uniref:Potassium transporter n=1 Tax=Veronia pacifica TaxID=1080227 RepID=A0A1C3EG87_9GAMM|nr:monovalent cation:proton antiporter-2 (CPA2) family protein [Veronia pacifica]ODA32233.1 potassium transporter [Veronia pacifica]
MTLYFLYAFLFLAAAVFTVPIAKKLGLGSVLGYLVAGLLIGPVTGLVGTETQTIQHFAEFGVVMMLFLVGLELDPAVLWNMRRRLIGLGGLQLALTIIPVTAIAMLFDLQWTIALTVGFIFSLSSTAIVLQSFHEKSLTNTEGGRSAFSVLLVQDIAVIPMLAIIPLLAIPELVSVAESAADAHHGTMSLVEGKPGWMMALIIAGSIAVVVVGGHYLSRPLFSFVAASKLREVFTATALMLVIGIAALMSLVGLSPALGTFLAGVVLANSEFRHELESSIEPFKGLLLGLFFITVGCGVDFTVLSQEFGLVALLTFGVILLKALVLLLLTFIFKIEFSNRWLFSLSLAQAGEFGFVLLSFSVQNSVLTQPLAQVLSLVVAFSMFLTPLLFIVFERIALPHFERVCNDSFREPDKVDEWGPVVIAGGGRFGQIVNRLLVANNIKTVVLDAEITQITSLREVKIKAFFGDATRPELLHTAGIEQASLVINAMDNHENSLMLIEYVKKHYPDIKILTRAFDRTEGYVFQQAGADFIISETYHSALEMGSEAMRQLGFHPFIVEQKKETFRRIEDEGSHILYEKWQTKEEADPLGLHYSEMFVQLEEAIKEAMRRDRADRHNFAEREWMPPPKGYDDKLSDDFKNGSD